MQRFLRVSAVIVLIATAATLHADSGTAVATLVANAACSWLISLLQRAPFLVGIPVSP